MLGLTGYMRKYLQSLKNSIDDMKLELLLAKAVKTSFIVVPLAVVVLIEPLPETSRYELFRETLSSLWEEGI